MEFWAEKQNVSCSVLLKKKHLHEVAILYQFEGHQSVLSTIYTRTNGEVEQDLMMELNYQNLHVHIEMCVCVCVYVRIYDSIDIFVLYFICTILF